jgi:N-acetylmuramoyl-L-alanine amidase
VSHVVSLIHHLLTLAFACVLFGAGTSLGGEIQTEPSWPTVPQVAAEEPSPRFLLVKQERAGASRYPIIVRDLRTWSTADSTRLVLDLNHKTSFSGTHLRNPDRVLIEVNNAILGKSSRQRVSGGTIPQSFQIAQSRPRVVSITLTRNQNSRYKVFSLDNPDRLVIDITQRPKDQIRQIGETSATSPQAPAVPLPTPPAIPSPTVTETARPVAPSRQARSRRSSLTPGMEEKTPAQSDSTGRRKKR